MKNKLIEFYDNRAYKELYQEEIRYDAKSSIMFGSIIFWIGIALTSFVLVFTIIDKIPILLFLLLIGIPMIIFGLYAIKESKKRLKELKKEDIW